MQASPHAMRCQPFQPVSFTGCKVKPTARALSGYVGCVLTPCGTTCLVGKFFCLSAAGQAGETKGRLFVGCIGRSERVCAAKATVPISRSNHTKPNLFFSKSEENSCPLPACCPGARNAEARAPHIGSWFWRFMRLARADRPPQGGGFSGRNTPSGTAGAGCRKNGDSQ